MSAINSAVAALHLIQQRSAAYASAHPERRDALMDLCFIAADALNSVAAQSEERSRVEEKGENEK